MPSLDTAESSTALMGDGPILTSCSFKGSENVCADYISDENLILEDWESYWNDLNARLTVSRMVSDSVIRGIVNAVVQEAAESSSSKEAEIARLSKRLQLYEPDTTAESRSALTTSWVQHGHVDQSKGNTRHLFSLSIDADKHLQLLKSGVECIRSSNFCKVLNLSSESFGSCCVHDHAKASDNLTELDKSIVALEVILATICQQISEMTYVLKDSQCEQQWQWEFQKEVDTIIFQSFMKEQREEFDVKLCKQKSLFDIHNKFWLKKVYELSNLHQELDSISKSILSIEPERSFSHSSHERSEEWNTNKRKDHFPHKVYRDDAATATSHMEENSFVSAEKTKKDTPEISTGRTKKDTPEVSETSPLLHMSKEDLISYYQNEINTTKRQYEAALLEKTEELFKFKRQCLKECGSLHPKRDKDFEIFKKKFPDVVLKLDKVLLETKSFSAFQDHHDKTCGFKQRIGSLVVENRRLCDLLLDKRKEVDYLSSQLSDAAKQLANYSTKEASLLKKVEKHKCDIKDVMAEAKREIEDAKAKEFIKDQVAQCIVSELICEVNGQMDDLHMENMMIEEFCGFMLRGLFMDAYSSINSNITYDEEKKMLAAIISKKETALELEVKKTKQLRQELALLMALTNEKENALSLELKESERLNQEIVSLSALLEEQSIFISDVESKLAQQNEHLDIFSKELNLLKDQASEKKKLISEDERESNLLRAKLNKALKRGQQSDAEISELNQRLTVLSTDLREAEKQMAILSDVVQQKQSEITILSTNLREAEKQKAILSDVVQQNQSEILSVTAQRDEQTEQLESIVIFVQELSKSVAEFESIVMWNIERRSARLETLCSQCDALIRHVDILRRREVWYRKKLEIRTSDLEKAENEVDLLGDEVDALLNILEKLYIALDHYSPILQHYPGVMEILKLVRRELKGSD